MSKDGSKLELTLDGVTKLIAEFESRVEYHEEYKIESFKKWKPRSLLVQVTTGWEYEIVIDKPSEQCYT